MMVEDPMTEKIKKVYRKNNYNNISIFPTIDANVVLPSVTLEGLKSDIADDYAYTADIIFNPKKGSKKPKTPAKPPLETDKKTQSNGQSYEELNSKVNQYKDQVDSTSKNIYNSVSGVGSLITGGSDVDPKTAARQFQSQMPSSSNPPNFFETFGSIANVLLFFINFINNTLIYICIVFVQIIYKEVPILPWGNLKKSMAINNWPWKLDLDVSPYDNLALDPSAVLADPSGSPILIFGNSYISAERYHTRQKILYDSNLVFNLFTEIILIGITWVFTNNAYYYIYKDPSTELKPDTFPYRVIKPYNDLNGVPSVKRGGFVFGGIYPFAVFNTLLAAPYDILFLMLFCIKRFTQMIGLYDYHALLYILLFLGFLWFNLKHFWRIYSQFTSNPFSWLYNPFFAIFIIYGMYQHYFTVSIINDENKKIEMSWLTVVCSIITVIAIFSTLIGIYPIIRMFYYFWCIYVFLGFQGFSNDTYNEIMKHEKKINCDSDKVSIFKTIRNMIHLFFQYFIYFVVFISVIANIEYLNKVKIYNSDSASGMKVFLSILFLMVFMFLVYSFLNANKPREEKTVINSKSYLNEKPPDVNVLLKNVEMPKFQAKPMPENSGSPDKPDDQIQIPGTMDNSKVDPKSQQYLEDLNAKVKKLMLFLNDDANFSTLKDNPLTASSYNSYKMHIQEFVNILKKIEEMLDDPITKELFQNPFYITKLKDRIKERVQNSSLSANMKKYFDKAILFLEEIIREKLDQRISKIFNEIYNIPFPTLTLSVEKIAEAIKEPEKVEEKPAVKVEENPAEKVKETVVGGDGDEPIQEGVLAYIDKVKTVFKTEMEMFTYKLSRVFERVFPKETETAISITQIYNTKIYQAFFTQVEPEMGLMAMLVSELYPEKTKPSVWNSIKSAAKVARNSIR